MFKRRWLVICHALDGNFVSTTSKHYTEKGALAKCSRLNVLAQNDAMARIFALYYTVEDGETYEVAQ